MPGHWRHGDGTLLSGRGSAAEVYVDGTWRRGVITAWLPVPGDVWEAETRVELGEYSNTLRVTPHRVRRHGEDRDTPGRA